MSKDSRFESQEWQILLDAVPLAGVAVMVAGRSGLGSVKEAFSLAQSVTQGKRKYPGNKLIQDLIDARQEGARSSVEGWSSPYLQMTGEEIREEALRVTREARAILSRHVPPEVQEEFRDWLLNTANQVAEAAKEGGLLGFGGERVSPPERHVIEQLRQIWQ